MRACTCLASSVLLSMLLVAMFGATGQAVDIFNEDFDAGYGNGTPITNLNNWSATGPGAIATNRNYAGTLAGYVPVDTSISNTNTASDQSSVFMHFYTVPRLYDGVSTSRTVDASANILFFFDENGYAVVNDGIAGDGTNWDVRTSDAGGSAATVIGTTSWTRVTVYANYASNTWALFKQYPAGGTAQLVAEGVGMMNAALTAYTRFGAQDDVYLDSIDIDTDLPESSDLNTNADGDELNDAWEFFYFHGTQVTDGSEDPDGDGLDNGGEENAGTDPLDPYSSAWDLPYYEDFEAFSPGAKTTPFHGLIPTPTVSISGAAGHYIQGAQGMCVSSAGGVSLTISDEEKGTNVWCIMYMNPVELASAPSAGLLSNDDAGGFCVLTSGVVYAYDLNDWVPTSLTVPTNMLLGFSVHLDYKNELYDLYVGTNGAFGDTMQRANASPLDFNVNHTATTIKGLVISNSASFDMCADWVVVTPSAYTNITDTTGYDEFAPGDRPGPSNFYAVVPVEYGPGNNKLSELIGHDLLTGLSVNDRLHIFNTNGWQIYRVVSSIGGGKQWFPLGADNPATVYVKKHTPLFVERSGASDAAQFAFNASIAIDPSDPIAYGPDQGNQSANGWNFITRLSANPESLANFGTESGEWILDATPSATYQLYREEWPSSIIWYQPSVGWRVIGGDANPSLPTMGRYYIRRQGAGQKAITDNN